METIKQEINAYELAFLEEEELDELHASFSEDLEHLCS